MKISILLPFKENFSPNYAGAVSLFVKDTLSISKFKKDTIVFGSTDFKTKFNLNYKNLKISKKIFQSQNKNYVKNFIYEESKRNSDLVELHNRPIYLNYLLKSLKKRNYILYFHNDPLSMAGSKTILERKFLFKNCYKIIFNSNWSKNRFLENMSNEIINSNKLIVIHQSAKKVKINFKRKKKLITFVGKLNPSKGYDLFGKTIVKILNKHKNWKAIVVGDEPRDKLNFEHKSLLKLGFKKHDDVLKIYKKASIAVVCSRWDEPFGRSSLEAASNGCAVIISNRGGLPETITNGIILKNLTIDELYNDIETLILNNKYRYKLQKLSLKNFYLTHELISKKIDKIRELNNKFLSKVTIIKKDHSFKILHVTNFNERHNGRLFFNTGRRINNGFIRLGHTVLELSDRDILKYYRSYKDINGSKSLNEKLKINCYNFKPDLIVLGHADLISENTLNEVKENYPNLRIAQWFLDPLNKNGPDYLKNKSRILNKISMIDTNFVTTSPDVLKFLPKKNIENYYIPNPSDTSFEILKNYEKRCNNDVFFALSHGVHRGNLKPATNDNREIFIKKLIDKSKNIKFDFYGINNIQPIWADLFFNKISNSKMGLNLSRGTPIKYYSSDRIAQIAGNGLVTLIDEKVGYQDFFNNKEMVFYKNINDLSEKILEISSDDKKRKMIAKKGKEKYMKYFNSNLVAEFIIDKSLNIKNKKKYYWEN